ncbi:MAG: glycosyltransferase family 9 protein [bacterium]|nr:glycosyltransferase family 9 protein [bacterium]
MPKHFLYIFGGAIGDALLGIQLAHTLRVAQSEGRVTLISTRRSSFARQIAAVVPEVEYRELPRGDVRSWFALVGLAVRPHGVVFLEPFQDVVSVWWKIIARMATLFPGSIEVRCQSRPQKAPARVRVLPYDPTTDNLFSMIARVVPLWGGRAVPAPAPSLPALSCTTTPARPYILFHFFAGNYRRSFPVEKVRPLLADARKKFPLHEFVLTCAHQEERAAREMVEGISDARVIVSPPAHELLCLLRQSDGCVGVASGVTHIASHLGVPSVVLCNLSDPCWLPSYAKNTVQLSAREYCGCHGDKTGECGVRTPGGVVYRCLYDITTERIIEEMKRFASSKL